MLTRYRNALVRWTGEENKIIGDLDLVYGNAAQNYDGVGPDDAVIDFIARTSGPRQEKILNRRVGAYFAGNEAEPDFDDLGAFEITYNFSNDIRNNTFATKNGDTMKYGSEWSFRILYEYLCNEWNGGHYFIDDYFDQMEGRPWYSDFVKLQKKIRERMGNEIKQKKKELSGKSRAMLQNLRGQSISAQTMHGEEFAREVERINEKYGEWKSYAVFRDEVFKDELKEFAKEIRDDCIVALSTGEMPLSGGQVVGPLTEKRRENMPSLHPYQMFYASGQLIENLNIYISLDREAV